MTDPLLREAADFRAAIERAIAEKASSHLPYFPDGACNLVSRLLAMHLAKGERSGRAIRFVSGHFPGKESYARHVWLTVDGAIVDLTADPFGVAPVVVGAPTAFHASLDEIEERDAAEAIAGLSEQESARLRRLLEPIESRLPASGDRAQARARA